MKVGVIAPSSVIPKIEFEIGARFLEQEGFQVECHPSIFGEYFFYPAPDAERASALIEFAKRDDLDILWCARGGYGATHLIPYLNRAKKSLQKQKKKLFIGYSDATALLEWFRVNLGWQTIHAPMPSLRTFSLLSSAEWTPLKALIVQTLTKKKQGESKYSHSLTPIYLPKKFSKVEASLVGGNLFVWNSMIGTPNAGNARGKILFLEEVQENTGRINRLLHHLEQSGGLKGAKGIVLGDFLDCPDSVPLCLQAAPPPGVDLAGFLKSPPKEAMGYLRTIHATDEALQFIFQGVGERNQIPVFKGLPVGHGPNHHSLFLGKKHSLQKSGKFEIKL
jgi:muramoyltetrapeptide carboxypeptidase